MIGGASGNNVGKTNLVIFELLFTPNPGGTQVYDSKNDAEDYNTTQSASRIMPE